MNLKKRPFAVVWNNKANFVFCRYMRAQIIISQKDCEICMCVGSTLGGVVYCTRLIYE